MALWKSGEFAVVQGVGYLAANLSHFRSIETWDTASNSDEYLAEGWLTRAFSAVPSPRSFAADGVVVDSYELGPFGGGNTRVLALNNPEQFLRQPKLAQPAGTSRNPALEHILKVEQDIAQAAAKLDVDHTFRTAFPGTPFGNAVKTAAQLIADRPASPRAKSRSTASTPIATSCRRRRGCSANSSTGWLRCRRSVAGTPRW